MLLRFRVEAWQRHTQTFLPDIRPYLTFRRILDPPGMIFHFVNAARNENMIPAIPVYSQIVARLAELFAFIEAHLPLVA
jgi:hypothetical protein